MPKDAPSTRPPWSGSESAGKVQALRSSRGPLVDGPRLGCACPGLGRASGPHRGRPQHGHHPDHAAQAGRVGRFGVPSPRSPRTVPSTAASGAPPQAQRRRIAGMIPQPPASIGGVGADEWTRVATLLVERGSGTRSGPPSSSPIARATPTGTGCLRPPAGRRSSNRAGNRSSGTATSSPRARRRSRIRSCPSSSARTARSGPRSRSSCGPRPGR